MEKEIEQMNIGICLLKQKEIINIIKNINHVSFEFYQENISLEEIASYGNMSVGHCGRLFM